MKGRSDRPTFTARLVARYLLVLGPALVVVAVILDRLLASGASARAVLVLGFGAAALLGLVVVTLTARLLVRPLENLQDDVARMGTGDLGARATSADTAEVARLAGSLNDLADRLTSRIQAVRKDRMELEIILAAMEEGVVLIDQADGVRFANAAARKLLGSAPRSLRALAPHSLQRLVADVRTTTTPAQVTMEVGFPARVLRASALPTETAGEVLVVLRDVTAARRVEAMRRDFVADASHELKTPAASIQASAETLERALADDPSVAAKFAAALRRDAVRLSRIISDLLDLSRLESERPILEPVRLDRLVAAEVARLRSQARQAGIAVDVEGVAATVRGSPKDLALLARNLLDNAIRYTQSGGDVRVSVSQDNGIARLTVTDTGIGIPSRDLPRIFERFYRVDRARSRETGGTGLGLSIARHVVEQHGGRIEAESELGRGSTFRVTLPLQ